MSKENLINKQKKQLKMLKKPDNTWWCLWYITVRTVIHAWREYKIVRVTLEDSLVVSYNAEHSLTRWPSSPVPRCSSTYLKTYTHKNTYLWIFKAALFIITKNLKHQDVFQSWMDKLWYFLHSGSSSIKKKKTICYWFLMWPEASDLTSWAWTFLIWKVRVITS